MADTTNRPGYDAGRDRGREPDANRDPITGEPGAHPVGTGLGAAGGGAAGAAIGAVGGPIGAAVGATVGAIAGGLAGKGVAESINPTAEDEYWRKNYTSRPYARGADYDRLRPAYRYGWESYGRYAAQARTFDAAEPDLRTGWEREFGGSGLSWDQAKPAARDAWDRLWNTRGATATTTRTAVTDRSDVVSTLNHLLETCKNGVYGFNTAADSIDNPQYAQLLRRFASEREQCANELKAKIRACGSTPDESGTTMGALHRGWIDLKGSLTKGAHAILAECERGEDHAVEQYQEALQKDLPADARTLIEKQYGQIKAAHDQIRALRDATER